jgi:hypothetical protein
MSKKIILKDEYYSTIYKIINDYDFGYVAQYASDEYSTEVRIIIQRLPKCETVEEIANMLYNLFVEYFSIHGINTDKVLYMQAAQEIYNLEVIK